MPPSRKDRLAAEAMERWADFQESLSSDKRKYPRRKKHTISNGLTVSKEFDRQLSPAEG
jgi:hypothetical protein